MAIKKYKSISWLSSETMMRLLQLAPLSVFIFKRPTHTQKMLETLAYNPDITVSPLYPNCDGERYDLESSEVAQKLVRDWHYSYKALIERNRDWGLTTSIIDWVTKIINKFGSVIVHKDDLVTNLYYIQFMTSGLNVFLSRGSTR